MKKNIIGLVGCGAWGKYILRDLISLNCRVYVAARSEETRKTALDLGAERVFAHSDELPECDGYVVAVSIPDLAPVSKSLIKRNKPIFSEKTLCLSKETADDLETAGGGKYIFVMHKWHYHPGIDALRVIANSGRIGAVEELWSVRHSWVDNFHGGDVFSAKAVHDLTIVKHILGYIPHQILYSKAIKRSDGLPISMTAIMGGSPVVNISVVSRHLQKRSGVSIYGSKGTAELNDAYDGHITVRDDNGEEKIKIDTTFPLFLELKEFTEYLNGGPKPRCGLQEAREVAGSITALRNKSTEGA